MAGRGFRPGWVLVSYLMIAGTMMIASVIATRITISSEIVMWLLAFATAFIGAFFAARASEGRTVIEPALGGGLFILSIVGFVALMPGVSVVANLFEGEFLMRLIGVAAAMAAGGLLGALIGERTSRDGQPFSAVRWVGIGALITLGVIFVTVMVMLALMSRGRADSESSAAALGLGCLTAGALLGGFVTQAIAPERRPSALGLSFPLAILPFVFAAKGDTPVGGIVVLMVIGTPISIGGAALGWAMVGKRRANSAERVASAFE